MSWFFGVYWPGLRYRGSGFIIFVLIRPATPLRYAHPAGCLPALIFSAGFFIMYRFWRFVCMIGLSFIDFPYSNFH